jgi:hypothetical protein
MKMQGGAYSGGWSSPLLPLYAFLPDTSRGVPKNGGAEEAGETVLSP